jgi:hypothetical protein
MVVEITEAELKAKIKEAVDAATEEAVEGLKKKNSELIGKLKAAQKDSAIDPAEHQALQAELDATTAKLTEANKAVKLAITESEKIKKAYENESKVAHNLLVENGLSVALLEAGVKNPAYQKAAKAMLAGQVILTADGENRIAKVGDKPLAEFIKFWAVSDEGKAFVDAPANGGGGASGGGNNGGGAKTMPMPAFEALAPTAKMEFIKTGGTITE